MYQPSLKMCLIETNTADEQQSKLNEKKYTKKKTHMKQSHF